MTSGSAKVWRPAGGVLGTGLPTRASSPASGNMRVRIFMRAASQSRYCARSLCTILVVAVRADPRVRRAQRGPSRGAELSIPNLITLGRILLVPIVVWAITAGEMRVAFVLFGVLTERKGVLALLRALSQL